MGNNDKQPASVIAEPKLDTIEALSLRHGTDRAVVAGVCAAQGWAAGKRIAEDTYHQAVSKFLSATQGGH